MKNRETTVKLRGDVVSNISEMQSIMEAQHGLVLTKQQIIHQAIKYALGHTSIKHGGKVS